eukprot:g9528.t1
MMKKNDPPEKSAVVPVPRAGAAAPRSHLRLFFSQSYYQLFGQWRTGYGYQSLIAGVIAVIMFGWVLNVLHRVTQGFFLSDSESLYEHFGRRKDNAHTLELEPERGYARWPLAPQPLMLFLAYLVIVVFGFVLYLGFIYSFIATVYFHVFEEKFSQMADTVQIYGVSPTVYWGTKFLANWSVAAPFSVAMWVWQSVVPSRNVDFRDAVLAGPSSSGVLPTLFGFFSMALFPVVAGACMAGCLGLTYGSSQGHAESTRSLLTTGSLILFLLFGGIELFLGSQPVSLIGLAVDFAFNVEAREGERTCFGRNETTNEPNPPPTGMGFTGAVLHFVFGCVFPGYSATKLWTDQQMTAADEVADAPALEVRKLSKSYDGKEFVNSEVSFRVEKGQIFALLGHNGAGKTTLMRQITALVLPTSGDSFVHGKSAQAEPERARMRLAFCPQGNPMWKGYTLLEHLEFFVELRGGDEMEEGKNRMLAYARKLGLEDKLHTKCECLSGGQKRRMWVLSALLQSKDSLLLLDEPTSGLDPQARRDFWLLLDEVCREENRACVFSTHNLEEADVLAEEKLILAGGRVVASGTSAAMKNEFGTGFWVTLQLDESAFGTDDATRATNGHVVFAVFRFRLQTELVSVLLPCLLTTAIVWVFCWRTPNTANLLFVATGELPSHFFLFLTAVGAGQFALAGRLREEREKGRLAHLIIHGISRTAYMVGTVLLYLLPALFVMLVGLVAAEQALSPPWTFASAGMRGTLWVIAIVYAVDVVLCGALLSEAPATVQAVFFVLSLAAPIVIFRNWPNRDPELALGPAEFYSPQAKLDQIALYPRRDWVSLFSMFQPKAWTIIGRGVLPLLLPNAAAAGVYAHTMRLRNLVVYLQTYLVERQKGPTYREIDIRKALQKRGGSEVDPESVKKAAAKIFNVNPETIIFDESEGKIKVPRVSAELRAGMEARRVVGQPLKKETQEQVVAALLTTTTNGNRNGDERMNNYGNDARLFFGGRLPDHLGELLDSLTPSEEVVKVRDFDAGSTGDGVEVDEGDEDDGDRLAAERAHAKIRKRTLLGGIRHPSWQSGTDVVETWHWSAWIGFVGGFLLRLVLWILLLACRRTSSGGSWGWKSGEKNEGVNKVFAQRYAAVANEEDVENDEDHSRPLTAEHDVEAGDGRDADVVTEEARVLEGAGEIRKEKIAPQTTASPQTRRQDSLTAQRLAKCFTDANGQEKRALNGVTFGVRPGECFGLLGPNGAGKSTLFTMLSGNYADTGPPTSGEITIAGEDVLRDAHGFSKVYAKMGIVPQFDHHLFPYANAQQHMELYLALRGGGSVILRDVGLDPRNTRPVGEYSGGMMRRMSFAISLVTNPEILLLDELTAGVDIVSQRLLWKKMQNRPKGQTIVTTSHSMAEVEAVCSRVCIMVGGELQCFGTTSRIKQVHGNMCQLDLYCCFRWGDLGLMTVDLLSGSTIINPSTSLQQKVDAVSDSIARSLYESKSHGGNKFFVLEQQAFSNARFRLVFAVDRSALELSKLVSWCLEDPLACIDDFVIGEPTIEQIFLKFAAKQEALELAEGED